MTVEPRAFRDAMGCFASAVTVVSTCAEDRRPVGVTVNSFNSVSLDPPLILFCLGLEATNLPYFLAHGRFVVNVLNEDQQDISSGFAKDGDQFFSEIEFEWSEHECPVIPGAVAVFECDMETTHDGGDHIILIGRVRNCRHRLDCDPLVYYRSRYAGVR